MHQRTESYRGQLQPWDPCYVIPAHIDATKIGSTELAARLVEVFHDRRLKAALYVNAVLMDLGKL